MGYFKVQKKLLKKTFKFNRYVVKSGLLDLLCFLLFFVMLLIVFASFNYFTTAVQVYEEDYSAILQDETLTDSFKEDIANDYVQSLKIQILVIVISLIGLVLLSYIGSAFIKPIQYNMLTKEFYKDNKSYFKQVLYGFKNTLPFFIATWSIIFILIFLFGAVLSIILINLVLFLIYWAYIPVLRLLSLRNKSFKKTWKAFFKMFLNSYYFIPVSILAVSLGIIIFILLAFLSSIIKITLIDIFMSVLQILVLALLFTYLRKYLFIITKVLRKKSK